MRFRLLGKDGLPKRERASKLQAQMYKPECEGEDPPRTPLIRLVVRWVI